MNNKCTHKIHILIQKGRYTMDTKIWNQIKAAILVYYLNGRSSQAETEPYIQNLFGDNLILSIQQTIMDGYLHMSSFEDNMKQLNNKQLRQLLADHKLSDDGTKNELLQRVKENIPLDDYKGLMHPLYLATEKGDKLIHDFYIYISERYFITEERAARLYDEMEKLHLTASKENYFKVNLNLLLEDGAEELKQKNWGMLSLNYSDLAYLILNFGEQTQSNWQQALAFLSMSLALTLTGQSDGNHLLPYFQVSLDGGKLKTADDLKKKLNLTQEDFNNAFLQAADHILPLVSYSYFTKRMMLKIVNEGIESPTSGLYSCKKYEKSINEIPSMY
jgi:hypothetical protein